MNDKKLDKKILKLAKKNDKAWSSKYIDIFGNSCTFKDLNNDHILPKSKMGANAKANLIPMCRTSNHEKDNLLRGKINDIEFRVKVKDKRIYDGRKIGRLFLKDFYGEFVEVDIKAERKKVLLFRVKQAFHEIRHLPK